MHPDPLFYLFGKFPVYAYGICMALGLIACFVFLYFSMKKLRFNEEAIDKLLLISIFGAGFGIFSAMVFQALYDYIDDPSSGYSLSGSMTFLGGLIGGTLGFLIVYWVYIYLIAPRAKSKLLSNHMNATLTDALPLIPIGITLAHAFGRLGCFFAGCCYGEETDLWIGLPVAAAKPGVNVVPTQLLEMIFLLLLAAVMAVLYFKFRFRYNFALYLFSYGVWRFLIEFVRDDYRGSLFGSALSPSQIWSVVMAVLGIAYVFLQTYVFEKHMKHPELSPSKEAPSEESPLQSPAQSPAEGEEAE